MDSEKEYLVSQQGMIVFGHPTYQLGEEFRRRVPDEFLEFRTFDEFSRHVESAEILVVSKFWRNDLVDRAKSLRFIQSISAGTEQFDLDLLRSRNIALATAQGANERAVAEHGIALMLALARQLNFARDRQARHEWRPMIAEAYKREQELSGQTVLIVGLGRIGTILGTLAKAFGMRVLGVRRSERNADDVAEEIFHPDRLTEAMARSDFVVLNCPLTPETTGLVGKDQIAAMKSSAYLINIARGKVVDQDALTDALRRERIRGAALDCFVEEPLPSTSPLWDMANVIITPHSAGETSQREQHTIDIFVENLRRFREKVPLLNQLI